MTRGTLTTFSIANDVAKYFAIIPALFMVAIPQLAPLNVMGLHSPESAILIYGLGGVIAPFIGIKLIDMVVSLFF